MGHAVGGCGGRVGGLLHPANDAHDGAGDGAPDGQVDDHAGEQEGARKRAKRTGSGWWNWLDAGQLLFEIVGQPFLGIGGRSGRVGRAARSRIGPGRRSRELERAAVSWDALSSGCGGQAGGLGDRAAERLGMAAMAFRLAASAPSAAARSRPEASWMTTASLKPLTCWKAASASWLRCAAGNSDSDAVLKGPFGVAAFDLPHARRDDVAEDETPHTQPDFDGNVQAAHRMPI